MTQPAGAVVVDDELTWTDTVAANGSVTFVFVVAHVGAYGDVVLNTAEYDHSTGSGAASATFTVKQLVRVFVPLVVKGYYMP